MTSQQEQKPGEPKKPKGLKPGLLRMTMLAIVTFWTLLLIGLHPLYLIAMLAFVVSVIYTVNHWDDYLD